jgi:polyvinyl alcohol dehydrogenase (cytochrome)
MRKVCLTILVIGLAGVASAGDWKMYLRDRAHSSFNRSEVQLDRYSIQSVQNVWVSQFGASLVAAPTLSDGVLYFGDWTGNFHAVRTADGVEIWKQFVGMSAPPVDPDCQPAIGVSSQAFVIGNSVYVGGGDAALYALDKTSGAVAFRVPLADPNDGAYLWSSIMYSQNTLYLGVASLGDCPLVRGELVRVDLNNAQVPKIRYLMPEDQLGAGLWSTPAIDEATNTLYITTGNGDEDPENGVFGGALLAMDASTLEPRAYFFLPRAEEEDDFDWGSSPTLFRTTNGQKMVGATGKDGVFYALSRDDLSLVWKQTVAISCICPECGCGSLSTPAFDGTKLYLGAGVRDPNGFALGSVYAINPDTGDVIWEQDLDGTVIAPVTIANGLVYVSTTNGLSVFDSETGEAVWGDGGYGLLYSQTIVQDGAIYNTYFDGTVVARRVVNATPKDSPPSRR